MERHGAMEIDQAELLSKIAIEERVRSAEVMERYGVTADDWVAVMRDDSFSRSLQDLLQCPESHWNFELHEWMNRSTVVRACRG